MKKYDYILVGSGLFSGVCSPILHRKQERNVWLWKKETL